jgi:hypothetical protein
MVDRFVEDILGSHPGDVGAHSCLMVSRLAAQIMSELRNKRAWQADREQRGAVTGYHAPPDALPQRDARRWPARLGCPVG